MEKLDITNTPIPSNVPNANRSRTTNGSARKKLKTAIVDDYRPLKPQSVINDNWFGNFLRGAARIHALNPQQFTSASNLLIEYAARNNGVEATIDANLLDRITSLLSHEDKINTTVAFVPRFSKQFNQAFINGLAKKIGFVSSENMTQRKISKLMNTNSQAPEISNIEQAGERNSLLALDGTHINTASNGKKEYSFVQTSEHPYEYLATGNCTVSNTAALLQLVSQTSVWRSPFGPPADVILAEWLRQHNIYEEMPTDSFHKLANSAFGPLFNLSHSHMSDWYREGQLVYRTPFERFRKHEGIIAATAKRDGRVLEFVPDSMLRNKEIVLTAVGSDARSLAFADKSLSAQHEVIVQAMKSRSNAFEFASEMDKTLRGEILNNPKLALDIVSSNAQMFEFLSEDLKNDKHILLAAIRQDGTLLRHASSDMQNTKEIVLAAVRQNGTSLQYASSELKNNREVVLNAVRQNGTSLQYASPDLRNNLEVALIAVRKNSHSLQYASTDLKNNHELVSNAVRQDGYLLQYASPDLKNNRGIVQIAIGNANEAFQFASTEIRSDPKFVFHAITTGGTNLLKYMEKTLRNDAPFMEKVIMATRYTMVDYASDELKSNLEFMFNVTRKSGLVLRYASNELRKNKELVLLACKSSAAAFKYADPELKKDLDFAVQALRIHSGVDKYIHYSIRAEALRLLTDL